MWFCRWYFSCILLQWSLSVCCASVYLFLSSSFLLLLLSCVVFPPTLASSDQFLRLSWEPKPLSCEAVFFFLIFFSLYFFILCVCVVFDICCLTDLLDLSHLTRLPICMDLNKLSFLPITMHRTRGASPFLHDHFAWKKFFLYKFTQDIYSPLIVLNPGPGGYSWSTWDLTTSLLNTSMRSICPGVHSLLLFVLDIVTASESVYSYHCVLSVFLQCNWLICALLFWFLLSLRCVFFWQSLPSLA